MFIVLEDAGVGRLTYSVFVDYSFLRWLPLFLLID